MIERKCAICGKTIILQLGNLKDYQYKTKLKGETQYYCSQACQTVAEELRAIISVDTKILAKARNTYGDRNQIAVCIEELSELAKVLAKYFRYDRETALEKLRQDGLDEVADVYIILEHVKSIFELRNGEVNERIEQKLERMRRWLSTSSDFSYTMEDRKI